LFLKLGLTSPLILRPFQYGIETIFMVSLETIRKHIKDKNLSDNDLKELSVLLNLLANHYTDLELIKHNIL